MKIYKKEEILDMEDYLTKEELEELNSDIAREPKFPANDPTWFIRKEERLKKEKEEN